MKSCLIRTTKLVITTVAIGISLASPRIFAASHTWSGAGLNGDWSIPANWSGNNPPTAGEAAPVSITFPSGAAKLSNTNNISGLTVDSILFTGTGYTINGGGAGTNLTLRAINGSTVFCFSNTTNSFGGSLNINLSSNVQFFVNTSAGLNVYSTLQGSGGFTKTGNGVMTLAGSDNNTYSGNTYVTGGTLRLDCGYIIIFPSPAFIPQVAIPGFLEVSGTFSAGSFVQFMANSQLSSLGSIQMDGYGTLDLNNYSGTCGPLIMNGGSVVSGNGTLTLNGNVSGTGGFMSGILSLGNATRQFSTSNTDLDIWSRITATSASAGLITSGPGAVDLESSNSFTGPITINSGTLIAFNPYSFGPGANSVTVNSGGSLAVFDPGSGLTINNVTLTLNGTGAFDRGALVFVGTNTWIGPVVLASDSVAEAFFSGVPSKLTLGGSILGAGGLRIGSTNNPDFVGIVNFSGAADNTFQGALSLVSSNKLYLGKSSGATAVPGTLNVGDYTTGAYPYESRVILAAANQIANSATVNLLPSGYLDLGNFNETLGPINFDGGFLGSSTGWLTLAGNVTSTGNGGEITAYVSLGGQTRNFITKGNISLYSEIADGGVSSGFNLSGTGGGLDLWASNSFTGPIVVSGSASLGLYDGTHLLGSGSQSVTVSNEANLYFAAATNSGRPLILAGDNYYPQIYYSTTNAWVGAITLVNSGWIQTTWDPSDTITLSGAISGNSSLYFGGAGTVTLTGNQDNAYSGITRVDKGTLRLQKTAGHLAIPGNLEIGNSADPISSAQVLLLADNQINPGPVGYVQVDNSGWLNLNNHQQTIPQLYFVDNGSVDSGSSGLLTLAGNVTVDASISAIATINGNLSLGGANRFFTMNPNISQFSGTSLTINAKITDGGAAAGFTAYNGRLDLFGSNSFSGPVVCDNDTLYLWNSKSLGNTASGLVLTNSGWVNLYASVTNESLTASGAYACGMAANGNRVWSGPIQLLADCWVQEFSGASLNVIGPITGTGNLLTSGLGTLRLSGSSANTFTGTTMSSIGTLELAKSGALAIYGPLQIQSNSTVRLFASNQILDTSPVTIQTGGTFDLNNFSDTIGDFNGNGSVTLGSGLLNAVGGSATNIFSGVISGNALSEFDKSGGNLLVLSGTNTYTGNTMAKGGTLIVNGSQPSSDVYIAAGATLGGNGTVRDVYDLGGYISPGFYGPGKLNCGNLQCNSGSGLIVEMQGTNAGVNYDQLNVTGAITLNSGVNLFVTKSFSSGISNQFVIVNNDLTDVVSGTFASLAQNAKFTSAGAQFQISYTGNSGNDIVLTQLTPVGTSQIGSVTKLGNGSLQFTGTGIPLVNYTVCANTNLATTNWLSLGTVSADASGNLQFTDSQASSLAQRFYRLSYP